MKIVIGLVTLVLSLLATVDINLATAKELGALYGIGSKKASAIVSYRRDVKCFKSIKELMNVKGIGKSIFTKNRANMSASSCK